MPNLEYFPPGEVQSLPSFMDMYCAWEKIALKQHVFKETFQ
jgi:hypothetical protein